MPGARILMIDDDQEFCDELAEMLADEGYSVSAVHDGATGKELAGRLDYDVLLLDLRLPLVSGFEILEAMKPHRDSVSIIVLSGYPMGSKLPTVDSDPDPGVFFHVAHRVFQKPFDVGELLEAIRTLSDRSGRARRSDSR